MIYTIKDSRKRIDIVIENIVMFERKKNPQTVEDEQIIIEFAGGSNLLLIGQDAADFGADYISLILPNLGGKIN